MQADTIGYMAKQKHPAVYHTSKFQTKKKKISTDERLL